MICICGCKGLLHSKHTCIPCSMQETEMYSVPACSWCESAMGAMSSCCFCWRARASDLSNFLDISYLSASFVCSYYQISQICQMSQIHLFVWDSFCQICQICLFVWDSFVCQICQICQINFLLLFGTLRSSSSSWTLMWGSV